MGTQEYIKGCLIAVGSVFFANGVQLMFTDNCHFVFGTTIAVFGILLILKGFKLKSEADKFFGYLKEAQEYAEHKSQIEIRNDCSNEEQEKLGLDLNSYMKFETTIANALGCFYKKGEALKIILDIHSFTQPRFVGGMLTKQT